jgi:CRP-like cAMP-binding protein
MEMPAKGGGGLLLSVRVCVMSMFDDVINAKCRDCPVRQSGLCEDASVNTLNELFGVLTTAKFPPGAIIASQGDPLNYMFIVQEGTVIVTNVTMDGRHSVAEVIGVGDFFGGLNAELAHFSYEASSPVTVCMIPRQSMARLAHEDTGLAFRAWEMTQKRADATREWLMLFNGRTTTQRLASYLCGLAMEAGGGAPVENVMEVSLPIKRKDLAVYLGTAPETLSRTFRQLLADGVLAPSDRNCIGILNLRRLKQMAGEMDDLPVQGSAPASANKINAPKAAGGKLRLANASL